MKVRVDDCGDALGACDGECARDDDVGGANARAARFGTLFRAARA